MPLDVVSLHETPLAQLRSRARALSIDDAEALHPDDLVFEIASCLGHEEGELLGQGVLEVHPEGFGFLRAVADHYLPGDEDIYVSQSQIRRFKLQTGDRVIGRVRPPKEGERYTALLRVHSVNGRAPGSEPPSFAQLSAITPNEPLPLGESTELRAVELVAPLGLGHRGLITTPSRLDPTPLLQQLALAVAEDQELTVTALLVGATAERIADWRNTRGVDLIATPFNETFARQLQVADIALERARRMVEHGEDALIIVDDLGQLARACAADLSPSGRSVSGMDAAALHRVRHYFSAARALEEGGSLTLLGLLRGDPSDPLVAGLSADLASACTWRLSLSARVADRGLSPPIRVSESWSRGGPGLVEEAARLQLASLRARLTGDAPKDAAALLDELTGTARLDSVLPTGH